MLPEAARRLDPHPDLWDDEARVALTHLVLSGDDLARLHAQHGADPTTVRAALLESVAERGGLTEAVHEAVLLGTVVARGSGWDQPVGVGTIVATAAPATAVPAWLADLSGWDGRQLVVPCRGHAIVSRGAALVRHPEPVEAAPAALLTREVAVPALVADVTVPGDAVAVLGATSVGGALAALTAAAGGASVVAGTVPSLADARLARALGVAEPVIVDLSRPAEAATTLAAALGGPADVVAVVVDDPDAVRTGVLLAGDGTVLLVHGTRHAPLAAATARALGTSPVLRVDRPAVRDAGAAVTSLVTSTPTLQELIRWRAGVGPPPEATRPEDA